MVHALQIAPDCLKKDGMILEVHDLAESPRIEVHSDRSVVFENYIRTDSFEALSTWLSEEWLNEYIPEYTRSKAIDWTPKQGRSRRLF